MSDVIHAGQVESCVSSILWVVVCLIKLHTRVHLWIPYARCNTHQRHSAVSCERFMHGWITWQRNVGYKSLESRCIHSVESRVILIAEYMETLHAPLFLWPLAANRMVISGVYDAFILALYPIFLLNQKIQTPDLWGKIPELYCMKNQIFFWFILIHSSSFQLPGVLFQYKSTARKMNRFIHPLIAPVNVPSPSDESN